MKKEYKKNISKFINFSKNGYNVLLPKIDNTDILVEAD